MLGPFPDFFVAGAFLRKTRCLGSAFRQDGRPVADTYAILFVCMGNICRSPTGEGVFRQRVEAAGLADRITIDSAGTIGFHAGSPADRRMQAAARKRGYTLTSRARQVRTEDFDRFDLILAMDGENLSWLEAEQPAGSRAEVRAFCSFCTRHDDRAVPDPYYGGDAGFERVLDLIEDGTDGLLVHARAALEQKP
ncbi:MAG: low molecular weight protein-tyrosine-phosphatase [Opitutales bacterium]